MDFTRLAIGLASGMIVLGALVACEGYRGSAADQADTAATAPSGANSAPQGAPTPASNLKSTLAAQSQPTATSTTGAQLPKPQPAAKSVATVTKPAAAQSKPPTPTVAPAAATSAKKQGDDLEQQLDQLLNGLDHTDTVDDAGR